MRPASPVVPGRELPEVIFAKDQPQYLQLPAYRTEDGEILTRWQLTWRERLRVLWTGNFYLTVLTFGMPLQPLRPSTVDWWNEKGDPR